MKWYFNFFMIIFVQQSMLNYNATIVFLLFFCFIASKIIRDGIHNFPVFRNQGIKNYDVIVVGGGMAGVSAAWQLSKAGKKVLILQANNYIGGRMKTQEVTLLDGQKLNFEFGANWMHGSNPHNPITKLANQMGTVRLAWTNYSSLAVYDEDGVDISKSAEGKHNQFQQIFQSFDNLQNKKLSVQKVLKENYPQDLQDPLFMYTVSNYFQFDQGASIDQVNSQNLQGQRFIKGEDQYVISGYQRMPQYLAKKSQAKILLDHRVIQVRRNDENDRSTVICSNGFQATAQSIVIAVPLGVLKAGIIRFIPKLPNWKKLAIKKISFGNAMRMLIVPKTPMTFLQKTQFIGIVDPDISERGSATFFLDFQQIENKSALVTFGLGANADELQSMPQSQLKALIAKRISVLNTSPVSSSDFDIIRSTWKTDPSFGGAYSFPGLQTSIFEWKNMARPLQDRNLYFCGEHTYHTLRSTVNGAYLSGIAAANDIIRREKSGKVKYDQK